MRQFAQKYRWLLAILLLAAILLTGYFVFASNRNDTDTQNTDESSEASEQTPEQADEGTSPEQQPEEDEDIDEENPAYEEVPEETPPQDVDDRGGFTPY